MRDTNDQIIDQTVNYQIKSITRLRAINLAYTSDIFVLDFHLSVIIKKLYDI